MKKYCTIALTVMIVAGCVDSEPAEIIERRSGFYYLSGPRITVEDSCFHCAEGEDTLQESVTFSLIVQVDPNSERVQFYGLQGADTGDLDRRVYPDCTRSSDCKIFGTIQPGGAFEIDIENNGHRYQAAGSIRRSEFGPEDRYSIELQGQYSYEDLSIDYDLEGEQVSFTLE